MPTVETSRDPNAPILITVMDHGLEPAAEVAPEGAVRLTVLNSGDRPHDLVIARTDRPPEQLPREDGRVRLDRLDVAGEVREVQPGGSRDAELQLARGRYVVFANAPGDYDRGLRMTLTVQPPEPYEPEKDPMRH